MLVSDLITALSPEEDFNYQGDVHIQFRGIGLKSTARGLRRRFYVLVDESWNANSNRTFRNDGFSAEEELEKAFENGAVGIICSEELRGFPVLEDKNVFFVENSYDFALRMVEAVRANLDVQRITAITGSSGKSTTKAMVTHALRAVDVGRVLSATGNQNLATHLISQLSRASLNAHVVAEVAGSAFLSYRRHSFAVSPDVSVITSISEAHLDYLRDLESVARIKSDLFQRPPAGGTAVINLDAPHSELLVRRAVQEGCQLVTYGESNEAAIRLVSYDQAMRHVVAEVGQERIEYTIGAGGKHMAMNSLAVIAVLRAHRIKAWRAGVKSLESFEALGGRGQVSQVVLDSGAEVTLIDEAYNANPDSIRASLEHLSERTVPERSRRVAILGDVLELGEQAETIHRSLAEAVVDANLDEVHLFGEHMAALHEELVDRLPQARHWEDLDALTGEALGLLESGDVVLVKASGGTGLKDFVRGLIKSTEPSVT